MKKKFGYFLLTLGAFSFLIGGASLNSEVPEYKNENTTYLLSLDNDLVGNEEKVKKNQQDVLNNLFYKLGYKFTYLDSYTKASNILKIRANSSLIEEIKNVPGVNKVYENKMYTFGDFPNYSATDLKEGYIVNSYNELDEKESADFVLKDEQKENQSATNMNAPVSNTDSKLGEGTLIAILDASFMIEHTWFKDLDSSLNLKLTKKDAYDIQQSSSLNGLAKAGVEQGELGSTYYNNKIPFYYDYGGDSDHNNRNDYDVLSRWDTHGTHVAGTAAANGDEYKGIAPNAQLALMKVFRESIQESSGLITASTGAYDADILEALEDCVTLKVDAVNMSLGSDLDDFSNRSASMEAFQNLRDMGCIVTISAGNGGKGNYSSMGPYMNWTTSMVETGGLGSYANDESSLIVASTTLGYNYYENALIVDLGDNVTQPTNYKDQAKTALSPNETPDDLKMSTLGDSNGKAEYVFIGQQVGAEEDDHYGTTSGYTNFFAYYKEKTGKTYDPSGKIAVVDRGSTSFSDKASVAKAQGFAGLVVINNDPTALEFNFSMAWGDSTGYTYPEIPVCFVLNKDRNYFVKGNNEGLGGELTVAKKIMSQNPEADQVSNFSSEGATYDLRISPDIAAPGSNVLGPTVGITKTDDTYSGRYAFYDKAWAYLDGTSMAAPNLCGASALILSDLTYGKSEEERKELAKTIQMREMSTATQYSVDNTDPISGETTEADVYYSPRRQGAGEVNVRNAINTDVYLEGLKVNSDGSFTSENTGKAKVELKNNDLIKDGNISLEFLAHNTNSNTKTYKASMVIMKPHCEEYYNYENHKEEGVHGKDYEFEGGNYQTNKDTIVKTVDLGTKVIESGDSKISVEASLTEEEKKAIDDEFENGTYLEGYVFLTPVDSSDCKLSIPYMGFYGDYTKGDAIEEFTFERDSVDSEGNKKFYPSDLVNYVGSGTSLNLDNMDMASTIVGMDYDTYYGLKASSDILYNKGNLINSSHVVTYNKETNTIYAGGSDSEVLVLQAFVLRSIASNSITIKDSDGNSIETVGDSAFYDSVLNTTYLYKSHVSSNYINSGIIAHRGLAYIPLYKNSNGNSIKLVDGNYTLTLSFTLLGTNTTQEKSYNLVIDSKIPEIQSRTSITKNGEEYIRVKYKETYLTRENMSGNIVVAVNGGSVACDIIRYAEGYYIDFKVKYVLELENNSEGKVSIDITDGSGNVIFDMFYLNSESNKDLLIESNELVPGSTLRVREEEEENSEETTYFYNKTYRVTPYDDEGNAISESDFGYYRVSLTMEEAIDPDSVVVLDKNGNSLSFTITDYSTLTFEVNTRQFTIKFNNGAGITANTNSKNIGLIVGLSVGIPLIVIAAGVTVFVVLLNKKKAG